jgi:hypothetical protein
MDKFKMELTWPHCANYPPKEYFHPHLLITDGGTVIFGEYDHGVFYMNGMPLDSNLCWWADIDQTVRGTKEFDEV